MRHDIIPGQFTLDVTRGEYNTEFKPPRLIVKATFEHIFNDRRSELSVGFVITYKGVWIGNRHIRETIHMGQKKVDLLLNFPISTDLQKLIEIERESNKDEDLNVEYSVSGMVTMVNQQNNFMGNTIIDCNGSDIFVSLSEWKEGLGLSQFNLVPISNITLNELENLRKKWGLWRTEEVIAKFLDNFNGKDISISHQLLLTFQDTRSIRDKYSEISEKSGSLREARITSPYLDNAGSEYIVKLLKNNAKVKIITRKGDTKKAQDDALRSLKQLGAEVKYDKMLHSRIAVFDELAAIVSSADLDSEGLNNQKQAGIYTTDRTVIRDLIVYFDKCWEMAEN